METHWICCQFLRETDTNSWLNRNTNSPILLIAINVIIQYSWISYNTKPIDLDISTVDRLFYYINPLTFGLQKWYNIRVVRILQIVGKYRKEIDMSKMTNEQFQIFLDMVIQILMDSKTKEEAIEKIKKLKK